MAHMRMILSIMMIHKNKLVMVMVTTAIDADDKGKDDGGDDHDGDDHDGDDDDNDKEKEDEECY